MEARLIISYLLWFFLGWFGGHRFYSGKYVTAILMIFLTILGYLTVFILVGWIFLFIIFIWWVIDAFLIPSWCKELTKASPEDNLNNLRAINELYELYQKGIITKEEYETKKTILLRN